MTGVAHWQFKVFSFLSSLLAWLPHPLVVTPCLVRTAQWQLPPCLIWHHCSHLALTSKLPNAKQGRSLFRNCSGGKGCLLPRGWRAALSKLPNAKQGRSLFRNCSGGKGCLLARGWRAALDKIPFLRLPEQSGRKCFLSSRPFFRLDGQEDVASTWATWC